MKSGWKKRCRNNIQALIEREGSSQPKVAKIVGVQKAAISKWAGKPFKLLTVENIMGVAEALNCQPIEVFDPDSALTDKEEELLRAYRSMNPHDRAITIRLVGAVKPSAAGQEDGRARPHPFPAIKAPEPTRAKTNIKTRISRPV